MSDPQFKTSTNWDCISRSSGLCLVQDAAETHPKKGMRLWYSIFMGWRLMGEPVLGFRSHSDAHSLHDTIRILSPTRSKQRSRFLESGWYGADAAGIFLPRRQGIQPRVSRNIPNPSIATPPARPIQAPPGSSFSANTNIARVATQSRFITPTTNSNAMSTQQHPRQ